MFLFELTFSNVIVNCHVNRACQQHIISSALESMSFLENPIATDVTCNRAGEPGRNFCNATQYFGVTNVARKTTAAVATECTSTDPSWQESLMLLRRRCHGDKGFRPAWAIGGCSPGIRCEDPNPPSIRRIVLDPRQAPTPQAFLAQI
jgi:hypothetical protein